MNIPEVIDYYKDKIWAIDAIYAFTQSDDREKIDYKPRKRRHVELKDLLEDIITDLQRISNGEIDMTSSILEKHYFDSFDTWKRKYEIKYAGGIPDDGTGKVQLMRDAYNAGNLIIHNQDAMIGRLTRKVEYLEDSAIRREEWLAKAKKDAGYDEHESFDKIWEEILAKAKLLDKQQPKS
jgi:hypothetical protein